MRTASVSFQDRDIIITATFDAPAAYTPPLVGRLLQASGWFPFVRIGVEQDGSIIVRGEIPRYDQRRAYELEDTMIAAAGSTRRILDGEDRRPESRAASLSMNPDTLHTLQTAARQYGWRIDIPGRSGYGMPELPALCVIRNARRSAEWMQIDVIIVGCDIVFAIVGPLLHKRMQQKFGHMLGLRFLRYNAVISGGPRLAYFGGRTLLMSRIPLVELHHTECLLAVERLLEAHASIVRNKYSSPGDSPDNTHVT